MDEKTLDTTLDSLYNLVLDTDNEMWKEYGTTKSDVFQLLDIIDLGIY